MKKDEIYQDKVREHFLSDPDLIEYLGHYADNTISASELLERLNNVLSLSKENADKDLNGEVLYVDDYGDPVRARREKDYDWEGA